MPKFSIPLAILLLAALAGCWTSRAPERRFVADPPESLSGHRGKGVRAIDAHEYRFERATGLLDRLLGEAGQGSVAVLSARGDEEIHPIGSGKLSELIRRLHEGGSIHGALDDGARSLPMAAGVVRSYRDGTCDVIVSNLERFWVYGDLDEEVELFPGDLVFVPRSASSLIAELYSTRRILAEWNR